MNEMVLKYRKSDSEFFKVLRQRVNAYLRDNRHSKYAGTHMYLQTAGSLLAFGGIYALLITNTFSGVGLFFGIVVMHFALFYTTIGIAHDAAHDCYAKSDKVNRAITLIFDLMGISSHYWVKNHVHSHHHAPNVPLHDSAIESFSLIRLHPKTKRHWIHKYQHIYMFGIYAVATIFQVYLLEFVSFYQNVTGFTDQEKHPWPRLLGLMASKLFMLFYSVLVPLWLIDAPAALILSACVVGHMVCGVFIGVVFQTTHLAEHTAFPEPDAHGFLPTSFAEHIMLTTADFCPRNPLVTFLSGGLNIHVAHHLFPRISQVHLPAMAKIVKETAAEFGLPYREYTLWGALRSHVRLLKKLGNAPSWEPAPEPAENVPAYLPQEATA